MLKPDHSLAYFNLGAALSLSLSNSGHYVEAAQRYLEAKERRQVDSGGLWATATATAFEMLRLKVCAFYMCVFYIKVL